MSVSIPVGFSCSLQLHETIKIKGIGNMFQSLSGFLARCNFISFETIRTALSTFQSLSGFLARCNFFLQVQSLRVELFQSLSGFLARCNANPSILCRSRGSFQSLSGFLARCNDGSTQRRNDSQDSFNPCRVFLLVATILGAWGWPEWPSVSIPVGFSCSLQHMPGHIPIWLSWRSFNPCRVFLLVATPQSQRRAKILIGFNPCRVFLLVATSSLSGQGSLGEDVSIPVGFSCSLQLSLTQRRGRS